MPLRFPALVAVDELSQEGGLPGVSCDELVLQELLGGGPLQGNGQVPSGEGWLGSSRKLLELGLQPARLGTGLAIKLSDRTREGFRGRQPGSWGWAPLSAPAKTLQELPQTLN